MTENKELDVLECIYENQETVHQRDLASIVGLSLGMTNVIIKRLAQKGLLTVKKVNNRNIRYIVSPEGIEAIARRGYRYLKRTIKNIVYFRDAIEAIVKDTKGRGFDGIELVGFSDLAFIVQHACDLHQVRYVKKPEEFRGNLFVLYSETYIPDEETKRSSSNGGVVFLRDALLRDQP